VRGNGVSGNDRTENSEYCFIDPHISQAKQKKVCLDALWPALGRRSMGTHPLN